MFAGLTFFILKKPIPTLIALALLAGGVVYTGMDYMSRENVKVERLKPLKDVSEAWNLMPEMYADGKKRTDIFANGLHGNEIWWGGEMWGFADTNYCIYKVPDEAAIYILHKRDGDFFKISEPSLDENKMRQSK